MWDEITYPFPNFNGCTVELWEWISNVIPHLCAYLSMLGLKLNNVSKNHQQPWRFLPAAILASYGPQGLINHRQLHWFFNRLFRRALKKTPKLHTTGPFTGRFRSQGTSNAGNVSISWRHHRMKAILFVLHRREFQLHHLTIGKMQIYFYMNSGQQGSIQWRLCLHFSSPTNNISRWCVHYQCQQCKVFVMWRGTSPAYISGLILGLQASERRHYKAHYNDVIMGAIASQITCLTIVYSTVYSGADQRKQQSSASLALCREFTGDRWISRTNVR